MKQLASTKKLSWILAKTPTVLFEIPNPLINWAFGIKGKKSKKTLSKIIKSSDGPLVKWSLQQLLKWKPTYPIFNLHLIHGTNDKLVKAPVDFDHHQIESGHFSIFDSADQINKIISKIEIPTKETDKIKLDEIKKLSPFEQYQFYMANELTFIAQIEKLDPDLKKQHINHLYKLRTLITFSRVENYQFIEIYIEDLIFRINF